MLLCLLFLASVGFVNGSIKKEKNYDDIRLFELKKGDLTLKVTNCGATFVSLILPDKNGKYISRF
jgi:aldose 1-epimerase